MSWPRKLSALAWPIAAAAAAAADPTPAAGPSYPGWLTQVQYTAPGSCPPAGAPGYPGMPSAPGLPAMPGGSMPSMPGSAMPGSPMPSMPGSPPSSAMPTQPGAAAPTQPGTGTAPAQPGAAPTQPNAAGQAQAPTAPQGTGDAGGQGDAGSAPSTGAFGAAPGAGTGGPDTATPNIAGNFAGVPFIRAYTANRTYLTQFAIFNGVGAVAGLSAQVPVTAQFVTYRQEFDPARGALFITENENPRPTTRAYFRYQYFNGIPSGTTAQFGQSTVLNLDDGMILAAATNELNRLNGIQAANGLPPINATPEQAALLLKQSLLQQTGTTPAQLEAQAGLAGNPIGQQKFNVHRETFGLEKTFCSDLFSIGVRLPLVQSDGEVGGFRIDDFGNASIIFKSLLYTNLETGNIVSGGMILTLPTGPTLQTVEGEIDSTFFQPFLGFIYRSKHCPRLFAQGFTGAVIPSDDRDVTYYFNDLAINYTVYRACDSCSTVQAVTPGLEFHTINPLNNQGLNATPVGLPHVLNVTGALHVNLANNWQITSALCVPVTGPKLFDYEALLAVDYRF